MLPRPGASSPRSSPAFLMRDRLYFTGKYDKIQSSDSLPTSVDEKKGGCLCLCFPSYGSFSVIPSSAGCWRRRFPPSAFTAMWTAACCSARCAPATASLPFCLPWVCPSCGAKKPQPAANGWTCTCGQRNTGKFCSACGKPRPAEGWTCACGTVNQGKFCQNCGAKKPANEPQYRCDKCGWQPEDPRHPPKFCPECGDPFDFNDQV